MYSAACEPAGLHGKGVGFMKRKARPLLVAGAGMALMAMASSSCSGNLLPPRPRICSNGTTAPDFVTCPEDVSLSDAGTSDAGASDAGVDGGTDAGGDGG